MGISLWTSRWKLSTADRDSFSRSGWSHSARALSSSLIQSHQRKHQLTTPWLSCSFHFLPKSTQGAPELIRLSSFTTTCGRSIAWPKSYHIQIGTILCSPAGCCVSLVSHALMGMAPQQAPGSSLTLKSKIVPVCTQEQASSSLCWAHLLRSGKVLNIHLASPPNMPLKCCTICPKNKDKTLEL